MKKTLAVGTALVLSASMAIAEDKTFRAWWFDSLETGAGIAFTAALEEFKTKHPDVKVEFELKTFDQMVKSGNMILNSGEAPDVIQYNKGNYGAGLAASQGLMAPLDEIGTKLGWQTLLGEANLQLGRYDENGIYGSGPLIGIAPYGEFVAFYYNMDLFEANGITVPTTFEELEAAMASFVGKGITPIVTAANDYSAQHLMYSLALAAADQTWKDNFQGLKAPLDVKPFVYAGEKIKEWLEKGYVNKDATGLKSDDMKTLFKSGQVPMVVSGTWDSLSLSSVKEFKVGKFLFPGAVMVPASTGNLFIVPANAKNKEFAYEFIDTVLSKKYQALLGNSGGLPIVADAAEVTNPIARRDVEFYNQLVARNGLGFYPDWPAPGYYDVMLRVTQALFAGTVTPEEFGERLREPFDEAQSQQ